MKSLPLCLSFASALCAQGTYPPLEMTEILIRPGLGYQQTIEVQAWNGGPIDTTGYHLLIAETAVPLPSVVIPPNGLAIIRLGANGTSTPTELFVPNAPGMGLSDAVSLHRSSQVSDPSQLVDYVGWGGGSTPQVVTAVQVERWSGVEASAALPALVGATLANRREARWDWVGPGAWFDDSTPTLGGANDAAMTWAHGLPCDSPQAPGIGILSQDPGPWIGELSTLIVSPVPAMAAMVLSTTPTQPIALDGFGLPGCYANMVITTSELLVGDGFQAAFTYTVPLDPTLVDFDIYMQAFVPDASAGNAAQAWVTYGVRAHVGSR